MAKGLDTTSVNCMLQCAGRNSSVSVLLSKANDVCPGGAMVEAAK